MSLTDHFREDSAPRVVIYATVLGHIQNATESLYSDHNVDIITVQWGFSNWGVSKSYFKARGIQRRRVRNVIDNAECEIYKNPVGISYEGRRWSQEDCCLFLLSIANF